MYKIGNIFLIVVTHKKHEKYKLTLYNVPYTYLIYIGILKYRKNDEHEKD